MGQEVAGESKVGYLTVPPIGGMIIHAFPTAGFYAGGSIQSCQDCTPKKQPLGQAITGFRSGRLEIHCDYCGTWIHRFYFESEWIAFPE